jgi:hypothetical protein
MGYEGDNEWDCLSNIETDDGGVDEQILEEDEEGGGGWIWSRA